MHSAALPARLVRSLFALTASTGAPAFDWQFASERQPGLQLQNGAQWSSGAPPHTGVSCVLIVSRPCDASLCGSFSGVLLFDGDDDFAELVRSLPVLLIFSTHVMMFVHRQGAVKLPGYGSVSLTAWVRLRAPAGPGVRFVELGNGLGDCNIILGAGDLPGSALFAVGGSGRVASVSTAANALPTGVWTHLAGTLDAQTGMLAIFKNGLQLKWSSDGFLVSLAPRVQNFVGRSSVPGAPLLAGAVDQISLFQYALSPANVKLLAGFSDHSADFQGFGCSFPPLESCPLGSGAAGAASVSQHWAFDSADSLGATLRSGAAWNAGLGPDHKGTVQLSGPQAHIELVRCVLRV